MIINRLLPCSMKILREFYFADWRFFVVRDDWNFYPELIFAVLCSSSREAAHLIFNFYCMVCPSKWCSFRWPIRANLCRYWIAVHFLCFTYCSVGDTDYRLYLSSGCFFQWKVTLFLLKSNVHRPSGTSLLKALFLIWPKPAAFYFAGFYSAGTNVCGSRSIRKIRKNKNPQNFHATR